MISIGVLMEDWFHNRFKGSHVSGDFISFDIEKNIKFNDAHMIAWLVRYSNSHPFLLAFWHCSDSA